MQKGAIDDEHPALPGGGYRYFVAVKNPATIALPALVQPFQSD
jgi:hypothetical protein